MKTLEQRVLEFFLKHESHAFKGKDLAKHIDADPEVVHTLLMRWASAGIVAKQGKKFNIRAKPLQGKLSVNRGGEGFVTVEGYDEDFFISPSRLATAMNRDLVMILPFGKKRSGKRAEAGILSVLERSAKRFVGTFERKGSWSYVTPDDPKFRKIFEIPDELDLHAKTGQKVVVDLLEWDDPVKNPKGKVIEIIGFPGEKGVDVLSAAKQHDIHFDFPKAVEEECSKIPKTFSETEILQRMDFRHGRVFTIDPYDAKDFDDAISIDQHENGHIILGVHIADVSHYVKEKTFLDKEAYTRGTSTYLVDRVIPMLPEVLSNELCSLRPHEDKFTFSCFMEIDSSGNVVDYDILETVIHSQRRFTYEEAQKIIEGKDLENTSPEILDAVRDAFELSKRLLKKRMSDGSIDFDTAETKFVLDENGRPISCFRKDRLDAHRLIEECMLLANQTVCRHIGETKDPPPYFYRVHDKPVKEKFDNFMTLMKSLGHEVHRFRDIKSVTPKQVQSLIASVKGTPHDGLIEKVAIRAMAKAAYSEYNIGHFGLAFSYYTHFTSPIRRYPDLVVHRLLKEYAAGMSQSRREFWKDFLPKAGRHCSDREKIATEAERDSIKVKQAEFIEQFIGEEFDGIVSGVVGFGLFIEISQYLIEGFVHVKDIPGDYFEFDEKHYRMIGRRRKKIYRLGDHVRIRVVRVNREKHETDFEIVTDR